MNITISQVFQIGAAVIAFITVILPMFGVDPKIVATVGGAAGTLWGTIGTILTTSGAQVRSVAANIDDPSVKQTIVPAVANLSGVDHIQLNRNADAILQAQGASNAKQFSKIEAPN